MSRGGKIMDLGGEERGGGGPKSLKSCEILKESMTF